MQFGDSSQNLARLVQLRLALVVLNIDPWIPGHGVLNMAWLVPLWRGAPKKCTQTRSNSLNRTLAGSRSSCASSFSSDAMRYGVSIDTMSQD